MPARMTDRELADEAWYWYLNGKNRFGFPDSFTRFLRLTQSIHGILPGAPRCLQCDAPLSGVGGWMVRPLGYRPSALTPKLCNRCEDMILKHEGGAEVELSLLFADIRGSTKMAEQRGTAAYMEFIQRFYKVVAGLLIERSALVSRLVGDLVIGMFVPAFSGGSHASAAIDTALELLGRTGHGGPDGPWAPIGIGVHTGSAYVGAVGSKDGVREIAVLGNTANLAARLSSKAGEGEILVSAEAAAAAQLTKSKLEKRRLKLKGIADPVTARVLTISTG